MSANWLHPEEKQISHVFMTRASFAACSEVASAVRLLPAHETKLEGGGASSLAVCFPEVTPRSWRKALVGQKADRRPI